MICLAVAVLFFFNKYIKQTLSIEIKNYFHQCYVHCVLEMMQVTKKGKLNYDGSMKQINTMLPEPLQEPYTNGLNTCRETGKQTFHISMV